MTTLAELVARAPNNAVRPDADVLHKRRIDELTAAGGDAAAAAAYGLARIDTRAIDLQASAVVACVVVRNEADRLPALLAHHRRLGVDRFFVIDNESTDDTVRVLSAEADVHLWSATLPFHTANFGAAWFDVILRAHARGHWVVIVDADEFLWYPAWETLSLPELCATLDAQGHRALGAAFLDMYADTPLAHTRVPHDRSPLDICRYFDRRWCHTTTADSGPFRNQVGLYGGVRRRVFGGRTWDYCLNKVPLLRYDIDAVLVGGQHATNLALAPTRGAVLHFKLDERLRHLAQSELERGQRDAHASEYHAYVEALALRPLLTAFDESESVELHDSAQLVELGVMGPGADLLQLGARAGVFLQLAETKYATGDSGRALAYLRRACDVLPTAISPLLRIAQLSAEIDGGVEASAALEEAVARAPGDLALLEIAARAKSESWAAVRALPPFRARVLFDECVDATFGWVNPLRSERRVHSEPWVGCLYGVPKPPGHIAPFARHGLAALWQNPELQRSLEHCKGLFTFSEHAAAWLRAHTDLPVSVVPCPSERPVAEFDFDEFARTADRQLVQLGWWMTRVNAICELPVIVGNPLGLRKVRASPAGHDRIAAAVARAERDHAGWRDIAALLTTTDVGSLSPADDARVYRDAIVFADLYDANADPVVISCMASATPILVNRHPAVEEYLGREYPLYFDSLDEAAAKVADLDVVEAAHRYLATDEVRHRTARAAFQQAIADSDVFAALT